MEIKIKANKYLYYKENNFENLEVKLNGKLQYNTAERISISINNDNAMFLNGISELDLFCKEVKGIVKESFVSAITSENNKLERTPGFNNAVQDLNEFSFNTFKSMFLLFDWLEIPLTNQDYIEPDMLNIEKTFYDEFVVDWTYRPESQSDIYLIKQEHITNSNIELLQHLIKINLLCEISIFPYRNQKITSYFTPLKQPGITKQLFEFTDILNRRKSAYSLWKKIIEERDTRIRNWSINRF
ncbi:MULTISPECIES: hypothetical protein [Sphingobacterium]|uniref:hypothetical protein n=1 Tax=Sphingobacterium TaxID=28453 RepID=UPI0028A7A8A9|nr:hypothetical protein [Sphingobacterium multivorum]